MAREPVALIYLMACTCLSTLLAAGEVSRNPPAPYETEIRPLLTTLEEVAKRKDPHAGKDEPGTIRLEERITRVNGDGTYLRAVHYIYQPYSIKGAESVANDRFRFHSRKETVHLALARTVLADGTEKSLGPNAVFLQKGERGSDSVYDDGQDLVVIFPDVKPGVMCEVVVVYEHTEPSVKGGYGELIGWDAGWPVGERRRLLDFPAGWKNRLRTVHIGKPVTTATEPSAPADRLRLEWKLADIDGSRYEPGRAPLPQAGPLTWLSTFASWDEMAAWYEGLLKERAGLDSELSAMVDNWTADAKSPREILEILHGHVANDIRYEGLEFGISGLQPYPCGTVWKNQYGDCKDKANLLVAMLRHKNITARVVLVNTEHAGVVSKDIPDYRHFNHAIAVAELPGDDGAGDQVFCDTTNENSQPGLLGPSSADREVLAIDGGKALWMKTPAISAGEDSYAFDLELTEEGSLAGWLTLRSSGYYGIRLANRYAGVDRETARTRLTDFVSEFIVGAEAMDFILPNTNATTGDAVLKIYVSGPARQADQQGRLSLSFPSSKGLFNDYGDGKNRETAYFQVRDVIRVDASIRLPKGWQAEPLPLPLKLDTPAYNASSSWTFDNGRCIGSLLLDCRESTIPADGVAVLAQANRVMDSWLGVPVFVKQGAAPDHPPVAQDTDPHLPLMPTGEGQLNLVNRLYPRGTDATARRAALEKTIRFFPNDPSTVFDARVQLAYLHILNDQFEKARDSYSVLVSRRPEGVGAEKFAYARYMLAMAEMETGAESKALAILSDLAADESLSDYRRGWSAVMAGKILVKQRPTPDEALVLLKQAAAADESCSDPALIALIPAMASAARGEDLVKLLAAGKEIGSREDMGAAVLTAVTDAARSGSGETSAAEILPWLIKARDQVVEEPRKKALADACAALENWISRGDAYATVRAGIIRAFDSLSPDEFKAKAPTGDAAQTEADLAKLYGKDREAWMALAVGYFEKFEPTPEFSKILWHYLGYLRNMKPQSHGHDWQEFFHALSSAADQLPKDDDNYWDCYFNKAWWLRDLGRLDEAEKAYRTIAAECPADFHHSAWHGLGEILELQARWKEAATCYLKFKDQRHEYRSVAEALLRAGIMLARADERKQTLETWSLLADVPTTIYAKSELIDEINEAIQLAADQKATLAQWARMDSWREKWFLPYYESLGAGAPREARCYLADQAEDLNLRCRKAVAAKDMTVVAGDLASVGESARWLPNHLRSLQQMMTAYVRPLWSASASADARVLEEGAATVKIGAASSVEYCIRMHAASAFDRGEHDLTLNLLEGQSDAQPGRDAEHRERCGYIHALAAAATGKSLEKALAYTEEIQRQGHTFIAAGSWACVHADLLIKCGRHADAVAFLKEKSEDSKVKASPETLTPILEKLAGLSKDEDAATALTSAARGFLKNRRPPWYDHVGPVDLTDARVGNPDKILTEDLSHFHPAEQFRLRMLIATSANIPLETRQSAFSDAVEAAGNLQRTWMEAVAVWSDVLENEALPVEMRLQLLWKVANSLAMEGQVEALADLCAKPLFKSFADAYRERYFPILQNTAKARNEGPQVALAAIAKLADRELDNQEFQLSSLYHIYLLCAGDLKGAETARKLLKSWKLTPQAMAARGGMRLELARQARLAKENLVLDELMRGTFKTTLESVARSAPAGWQKRVDLENLHDLPDSQAEAVRAAIVITGFRHDRTNPIQWFGKSSFWLNPGGRTDRPSLLKIIPHLLSWPNDFMAGGMTLEVLTSLDSLPDGGWNDIDRLLEGKKQAARRPALDNMLEFWRFYRDYKPDDAVDVARMLELAKQAGVFRKLMIGCVMESLIANGDIRGLETTVAAINPDDFSDATGIGLYIEALQLLGRQEELELVLENSERVIREEMMTAWMDGSPAAVRHATELAIQCDLADILPSEWRAAMPGITADKLKAGIIRARMAGLASDWKLMKSALEDVEKEADNDGGWNFLMGRALVGQGRADLARPHLEKVIHLGLLQADSYRQATSLLKQLDAE